MSVRALPFVVILTLLAGCEPQAAPTTSQTASQPASAAGTPDHCIRVFVSIQPQAYFAERVGGQHVKVDVLVDAGQSPHTFSPTPKQMAALNRADVYFAIGESFEQRLLEKITAGKPDFNVVNTQTGVKLRMMETADDCEADHDHEHEHAHEASGGTPDPHIWLDPNRVKIIAKNMCAALVKLDPDHADDYRANLAAFQADLDAVDAKIAKTLAPLKGRDLFVFHPAYGYFADAYGLRQVAVEIEGKAPTPKQVVDLINRAKHDNVHVIFVQPQFPASSAEAIAREIDGAVVKLDPLARDYLANLESKADEIARALGAPTP